MTSRTLHLHRVLRAPPNRVYRAFLEADALAKWLPPHGFTCQVQAFEARVGGRFRMSFRNFSSGHVMSFGGEYLELIPDTLIRYTDTFDDPNLPGTIEVTVALRPVLCGTEVTLTQAGIPDVIPLEMCHLGWQESLAQLATLVEPDMAQYARRIVRFVDGVVDSDAANPHPKGLDADAASALPAVAGSDAGGH
eukprot:gene19324-27373_t